jgi:hypothetical protein
MLKFSQLAHEQQFPSYSGIGSKLHLAYLFSSGSIFIEEHWPPFYEVL